MSSPEMLTTADQIFMAVLTAGNDMPDVELAKGARMIGNPNNVVSFGDNTEMLRTGVLGASIVSLSPDGSAPTFRTATFGIDNPTVTAIVDAQCTNALVQTGATTDDALKIANVINTPVARKTFYRAYQTAGTCALGGAISFPIMNDAGKIGMRTQLFANKNIFDHILETQRTKTAEVSRRVLGAFYKKKTPDQLQEGTDTAVGQSDSLSAAYALFKLLISNAQRRQEAPLMVEKPLAVSIPPSILARR
jgi:hypothetical protein